MLDIKEKKTEIILQQLRQLPTLPAVAVRVLELTGRDEATARQVVELISSDQSLTARILQLVRRADQGVPAQAATVERAVVLLGFEMVRCAVLALTVFQVFERDGNKTAAKFDRAEFWKHSLAVACCAELLAAACGQKAGSGGGRSGARHVDNSEAFVCGLLHDLGKVAIDAVLPKSYDRIVEAADLLRGDIADVERSVIGLDHMVAGKRLAEMWSLPPAVRDCMWLHGQSPAALPASAADERMVNIVTLADVIVRQRHLGYSGNHTFPVSRQALLRAVGLDEQAVESVEKQLVEHIEKRAAILGLGTATTAELYLSALTRANQELGRVSEQLAAKNRRLAVRSRFFDALAQFQGELRPDAAPSMVLPAIGQTAVAVLGVSPVAVFSVHPGQTIAELALVDEEGEPLATSLVDCPPTLPQPAGGEGPVLSAGPEMEWVLAAVSPRLGHAQRYWMCLESEGACIGGVVWGARPGEAERLAPQAQEISALCAGWSLALRMAQVREESRNLAEQLAEVNRQLNAAQEQLVRTRSLAAVGELAAGAAHEINTPLAVLSGRAQLLASQVTDPRLRQAASVIVDQAHRVSQIITDLMEFARPEPPKPRETDIAELLDRALYEVRSMLDPGARRIEVSITDVPPVVVDPVQVQNALVQVLHNAVRATDEKDGHIAIHAAYDVLSSRVVVAVTDNGCGMDADTLKRAFDPFFSSQPAGRRRGMGLAKALRWIEANGGSIRLESRPNQGTRAIVLLPAAWPAAPGACAVRKAAGA